MPLNYDLNTHLYCSFESDATEQSFSSTVQLRLLDRMIVKISSEQNAAFCLLLCLSDDSAKFFLSDSFIMLFPMQIKIDHTLSSVFGIKVTKAPKVLGCSSIALKIRHNLPDLAHLQMLHSCLTSTW